MKKDNLLPNWQKELKELLSRRDENIVMVMDLMIEDFIKTLLEEQVMYLNSKNQTANHKTYDKKR